MKFPRLPSRLPCRLLRRFLGRQRRTLCRLRANCDGVSLIEFALVLPLLLTATLYGTELAYMATVRMQISQIATSVADNASRLGQSDNAAVMPTVSEGQIASIMFGALQQGQQIDFEGNGRIILSSLERDAFSGNQYIHWQRCVGNYERASDYGSQIDSPDNIPAGLDGMGTGDGMVTAIDGSAVMYAEVFYRYRGLFGNLFVSEAVIKQEAAFMIRDDRNLVPGVSVTAGAGDMGC